MWRASQGSIANPSGSTMRMALVVALILAVLIIVDRILYFGWYFDVTRQMFGRILRSFGLI
jgi:hypothetical protein